MNPHVPDPMSQLEQGSRVMVARTILHEDPAQVTEFDRAEVMKRLDAFLETHRLPRATAAKSIGVAASTLSQVAKGKYLGDWRSVVLDVDRWLDDEAKREASARPAEFVTTSVAREIQVVADMAIHLNGIAMIYGDAGIGKTVALHALEATKPGAVYVSCETIASGSAPALVESIGRALRVSPGGRYVSARFWMEAIKRTLRGSGRLLIVDQVHKLCGTDPHDRALFALCDLADATGAPQLWAGTIDLVAYLEKGEGRGRETLSQIRSRIAICRDLHQRSSGGGGDGDLLYTIEDVRKVFSRNRVRLTRDAERYLMRLANVRGSGGLRTAVNAVRLATKLSEAKGAQQLDAPDLQRARELLATRRIMQRTAELMELEDAGARMAIARTG